MALRYPGGFISSTAPTVNANTAKGVWTLEEAMQYIKAGQWPVPTGNGDPYFQYNSILLPGQGTNGANNNTFLDSSTNNFTITRNGNTTQGTFTPFSQANGYWGNFFVSGSSQTLQIANNNAFKFGAPSGNTNDFTVEFFVYPTGTGIYSPVFTGYSASNYWGFNVNRTAGGANTAGYVQFYMTDSFGLTASSGLVANQWNHICAVRTVDNVSLYINGIRGATGTSSVDPNPTQQLWIGGEGTFLGRYLDGYISNLRIIKGSTQPYSASSSSITVPTGPLTAITGTTVLTCQSNRFIDNSTNALSITATNGPQVTPFEPFGAPTSAYSASTVGGSGYFDGSGDYLTTPSNSAFAFGTGDFTMEAWIYVTSLAAYQRIFYWSDDKFNIDLGTDGSLSTFVGGVVTIAAAGSVKANSWTHVVLQKASGTMSCYVNGARTYNASDSTNPSSARSLYVAANNTGANPFVGYISDVRIIKGTAQYSGTTITVPTAPLTAVTNTQLLLSGTNAGIIDNAEKNDLETVGNAQISTSQYKWGASSMYFDGSGDYLQVPASPNLAMSTGDFTVECWIYPTSFAATQAIISFANTYAFYINTSGVLYYAIYGVGDTSFGNGALSLNTWTHLAFVRTGGVIKCFINGNQAPTTIASTGAFGTATDINYVGQHRSSNYFNGYIADMRVTKGYARYLYNFTAPTAAFPLFYQAAATPSSDPYFENTTLLLPGNGTNGAQNNTFLDSSTNAFTITRNGNTTQGTFTPFSQTGWSNSLTNKGHFTFTGTSAFSLDGDFTLECWVYLNSYVGSAYNELSLFNNRSGVSTGTQIDIGNSASSNPGNVVFWHNGSTILSASSSGTVPLGQWTHLAFVRSGTGANNFKFYVNGVMTSQASSTATFFGSSGTFYIGQTIYDQPFNNTISNFRITKGGALYTSNFIPSTTPLTTTVASGTVSLLTCQSNRFVDNSASPVTLTPVTSPSVQAFSPFNPTASYSTSTVGGSGYFDGSGDYLTASSATAVGSGSFCFEAWIYPTNASAAQMILGNPTTGGMWIGLNIDGANRFGIGRVATAVDNFVSYTWTNNQWHHIAVNRNGTSLQFFVNGTQVGSTATNSINYSTAGRMIGGEGAGTSLFTGYISGWRFVDASTYTTTFTVPTAPPTAITNTSLLLNFTNGGITDATAKNDLETVGGASISTTVSKFGGSSMYFDGSGDYLSVPHSVLQNMAGGDITIECWVYVSAKSNCTFFAKGSGASNWEYFLGYDGTTLSLIYNGNTSVTMTDTISLNTWTHVAMSRYGSSLMVFINGVRLVNATYSGTTTYTNPLGVGAAIPLAGSGYVMNGYIQDFRLTKGIARYTQNFTPPTSAFLTL